MNLIPLILSILIPVACYAQEGVPASGDPGHGSGSGVISIEKVAFPSGGKTNGDKCDQAYAACISGIATEDRCVEEMFPQRCIESCLHDFGYSQEQCEKELCLPVEMNVIGWYEVCRGIIEEKSDACLDARNQCKEKRKGYIEL